MIRLLLLSIALTSNIAFCQSDTIDLDFMGKYILNTQPDSSIEVIFFDSTWTKKSEGSYMLVDSVECKNCDVPGRKVNYITDTGIFLFEGKCAIPIGEWKEYNSKGQLDKTTFYSRKFYSYGYSSCNYNYEEKSAPIARPCPGTIIYEAFPKQISYYSNDLIIRIEYYEEGLLDRVITYAE